MCDFSRMTSLDCVTRLSRCQELSWGLAHAGKIVDRHWYNRNKHIFPASRWEDYDPDKVFDLYTTHGTEVKIWNGIM